MINYKYISDITVKELESNVVISCINEDGYRCILIKNSQEKIVRDTFGTDNLGITTNAVLKAEGNDYFFHIFTAKSNDKEYREQFDIIYEYLFGKLSNPITDLEVNRLIGSLEEFFKITPLGDSKDLQVGLFGELFALKYLYENGYQDIFKKYHTDFFSKHDLEINSKTRIEVKATEKEKRIHSFSHNQIYRPDLKIFVISLMLEIAKEGVSLYDLSRELENLYSNPDFSYSLCKVLKRCGVNDKNPGLCFTIEKAYSGIKFFDVDVLPKINMAAPDGVTNIKYEVDCSTSQDIPTNDFINLLSEKGN